MYCQVLLDIGSCFWYNPYMNREMSETLPNSFQQLAPVQSTGERRPLDVVVPRKPFHKYGRPKGTRNMTTILRQAILDKQEHIMLKHLPRIVKLACEMAEKGDLQAMKMIMDRMVPVQKPTDGLSHAGSGSRPINIIITNGNNEKTGVTIDGIQSETDAPETWHGDVPSEWSGGEESSEDFGTQER